MKHRLHFIFIEYPFNERVVLNLSRNGDDSIYKTFLPETAGRSWTNPIKLLPASNRNSVIQEPNSPVHPVTKTFLSVQ